MNPKPFSSLTHFTVPVGICPPPPCRLPRPVLQRTSGTTARRRFVDGGQTSSPTLLKGASAALERRVPGALLEEGPDGLRKVLGLEQGSGDLGHPGVRAPHALFEECPHHA